MVDAPRLRALLQRLEERCRRLDEYAVLPVAEYLARPERIDASKYLLVTVIEDALSAANHVIAAEGYRPPGDYADAFRSLAESGTLEPALSDRLQRWPGSGTCWSSGIRTWTTAECMGSCATISMTSASSPRRY